MSWASNMKRRKLAGKESKYKRPAAPNFRGVTQRDASLSFALSTSLSLSFSRVCVAARHLPHATESATFRILREGTSGPTPSQGRWRISALLFFTLMFLASRTAATLIAVSERTLRRSRAAFRGGTPRLFESGIRPACVSASQKLRS